MAGHSVPVPAARAVRRASAVALDGKLGDAAWADAPPIAEFTQFDPDPGKPASQRTEVRFLFDADALYVGARLYDTQGRPASAPAWCAAMPISTRTTSRSSSTASTTT
jgi:hypothetical protein